MKSILLFLFCMSTTVGFAQNKNEVIVYFDPMPILTHFKEHENKEAHRLSRQVYSEGIKNHLQKNQLSIDSNISRINIGLRVRAEGYIDSITLLQMDNNPVVLDLIQQAVDSIGELYEWTTSFTRNGTPRNLTIKMAVFIERDHSVSFSSLNQIICQSANTTRYYTLTDTAITFVVAELEYTSLFSYCSKEPGEMLKEVHMTYFKKDKLQDINLLNLSSKQIINLTSILQEVDHFKVTSFHENGITKIASITRTHE